MREECKAGIEQGARARAYDEDFAGRKSISQSAQSEAHGSQNEAELHCTGEQTDPGNAYTPGAHEIRGRTVGTEPERCAEQLCDCYSRDWVGAHDFGGSVHAGNTTVNPTLRRRVRSSRRASIRRSASLLPRSGYFIVCLPPA